MNENLWKSTKRLLMHTFATSLIVCICCSLLLANKGSSQTTSRVKIDLRIENETLLTVFNEIQEKTQFKIISSIDLEKFKGISIDVIDTSVKTILDDVTSQAKISYIESGNNIIIRLLDEEEKKKKSNKSIQTGSIQGKVYDKDDPSEILIGASVRIEGTEKGQITDVDGNFSINNVPVGTYNLIVSYIGYRTTRVPNLKVTEGNITTVEIPLEFTASELDEVVVTAEIPIEYVPIQNTTELDMIESIRSEQGIVTGMSNFQISRSLDRNAADLVRRVPGLSVLNDFVLVRGMNTRYTKTFINDMITPDTETDEKAFNFQILPTGLIDEILVYKSPRADLPGEWAGGIVKVKTKRAQQARRIQINANAQYLTDNNHLENHYSYTGTSSQDRLTNGLNDRRYPDLYYNPEFEWLSAREFPEFALQQSRDFPEFASLRTRQVPLDMRLRVNYYDSWSLFGKRVNNLMSVGYSNANQFNRIEQIGRFSNNLIPISETEQAELFQRESESGNSGLTQLYSVENQLYRDAFLAQRQIDSLFENRVRISVLEQLDLILNDKNSIGLTFFLNRQGIDQAVVSDEYTLEEASGISRYTNFEYTIRNLYNLQLSGEHELSDRFQLSWRGGNSRIYEEKPDVMRQRYLTGVLNPEDPSFGGLRLFDPTAPYRFEVLSGSEIVTERGGFSTRGFFITEEERPFVGLDLDFDLTDKVVLGAGGQYLRPTRDFQSLVYAISAADPEIFDQDIEDSDSFIEPWFNMDSIYNTTFREDNTGTTWVRAENEGAYETDETQYAMYIDAEASLFKKKLNVYAGLRYEYYQRDFFDENGILLDTGLVSILFPGETFDITEPFDFLLPSFILTYDINTKHRIKASYGQTIDRPALREQTDFSYYKYEDGAFFRGNQILFISEIDNYDLRYEWYPGPTEFLSLGVFYKDITNPIELFEVTQSTASRFPVFQYFNSKRAVIYGTELEIRKTLDFIPLPYTDRFSVILNGAYIWSESEIGPGLLSVNDGIRSSRQMFGQSPYLLNGGLYFNSLDEKTSVSLLYNVTGPRIIAAEARFRRSLIEKERHLLDIVWSQQLFEALRLQLGIRNILNEPVQFFRDANENDRIDINTVSTRQRFDTESLVSDFAAGGFTPGIEFSFGLQFEF